jgi:hypothetical protein
LKIIVFASESEALTEANTDQHRHRQTHKAYNGVKILLGDDASLAET